ncbi:threonine synthase [Treponema sp. OMZ 799]|uniref:threonine synthase n=1 Tax=Treponema sp. OMZ 799 TaxID=2563668 RepID=UPI0020A2351A|nr:threonine synthase [Treponema sp. OMZ 799]UTC77118.1 threonine synthase [Treponema sp. OMZ 799]
MDLVSTRNNNKIVSFYEAVTNCMPADGGLYIPKEALDLSDWTCHLNETSSFTSIAGTLTSAILQKEFSPAVSERIAVSAFGNYSPRVRQLDERLFLLDLFHGPTGCHRDFGFLWFASVLEHILTITDKNAIVLGTGTKKNGQSMAAAFGNKKRVKTLLIHPRGYACGIPEKYLAENGGSIYSVECDGDIRDVENLKRSVYLDRELVEKYGLTLANTVNIGRLLPQIFFYFFAFTRFKKHSFGEIYYALHSGNYGNLSAGLFAWKSGLSLNGFITDSTPELSVNKDGDCFCKTMEIPLGQRSAADPVSPSNIERLEQIFEISPAIMKALIFPKQVESKNYKELIRKAYQRYGIMIDTSTAAAYGAAIKSKILENKGPETLVLISKDHPAFEADIIEEACGEKTNQPEYMKGLDRPIKNIKKIQASKKEIENMLQYMER